MEAENWDIFFKVPDLLDSRVKKILCIERSFEEPKFQFSVYPNPSQITITFSDLFVLGFFCFFQFSFFFSLHFLHDESSAGIVLFNSLLNVIFRKGLLPEFSCWIATKPRCRRHFFQEIYYLKHQFKNWNLLTSCNAENCPPGSKSEISYWVADNQTLFSQINKNKIHNNHQNNISHLGA